MFILVMIGAMFALDIAWLLVSARLAGRGTLRSVTVVFMLAQIGGLFCLLGGRMRHAGWDRALPKFASSAIYLWHLFGLGILILVGAVLLPMWIVWRIFCLIRNRRAVPTMSPNDEGTLTRRQFLRVAAVAAPPLFTLSLSAIATAQLNHFRIRRFALPVPDLPRDLDGLTIAHVSDIHVGRFTSGRVLREMVNATNDLRADLVLLMGDLINDAISDLSEGLELVKSMHGRLGMCMIEGNHDLIENGPEFERRAGASGIPFLLDESMVLDIHGHPVQLLGLRWTRGASRIRDEAISESVRGLLKQRREDAFPILLAHHPHAFDAAAQAGLPLILSGHTHGGQLMLNSQVGFGPELFRYWSGLYVKGNSRMIVSNGVGNWFPLRINAPAEIVHITLRRGLVVS